MEVGLLLADGRTLVSPQNFSFHPDPVILEIGRAKVFASGGVNITVSGTDFKMKRARMTITSLQGQEAPSVSVIESCRKNQLYCINYISFACGNGLFFRKPTSSQIYLHTAG